MTNDKSTLHRTAGKRMQLLLLLPLLFVLSAPVQAGLIQINFTATISNDGGITNDNIFGSFTLDSNVLFSIGTGAIDGVIDEGEASLFGTTQFADTGSAFSFVSAAQRTGYGALTLIADYGTGFFALDLASDAFFTSANVFDVLTPGLTLGDLRAYNPTESALGTTRFVNLDGYTDEWAGALTAFSVVIVPEPGVLWLLMFAMPALVYWRRRT